VSVMWPAGPDVQGVNSMCMAISVCPQVSFHTDVQFYVRTPKGKCMGPKLLNALLCMHAPAPCHDASSS
jgi:hypothetical protein